MASSQHRQLRGSASLKPVKRRSHNIRLFPVRAKSARGREGFPSDTTALTLVRSCKRVAMGTLALMLASLPPAEAAPRQAPFYADKSDLLYYLDASAACHPVRSRRDWNRRRSDVLANMQLVMGPLPAIDHHLRPAIEVLKEVCTERYTWRRITYAAESGDRAYAYLYIPHGLSRNHRAPGIISLHGTTYSHYIPQTEVTPAPKPDTGDAQYAQELA